MLYEAARSLLTHPGKWSWLKAWACKWLNGVACGMATPSPQTLPTIIGKGTSRIEPPHTSKPIMRPPRADLEEKREPPGRYRPMSTPTQVKSEVK
jgi:hypothetical protein